MGEEIILGTDFTDGQDDDKRRVDASDKSVCFVKSPQTAFQFKALRHIFSGESGESGCGSARRRSKHRL